ncbi:MAG: helix-turn-helix transcriptional regulator [Theionarchaea archaeon]|nr:helix-turn-helix transcriptional regulator [Theionarchaea archaeon]
MSPMTESARKILKMLRGTELSQKEIIQKSGMTERTVRYILSDLLNHQLINMRRTPKDKRLKLYSLTLDMVG